MINEKYYCDFLRRLLNQLGGELIGLKELKQKPITKLTKEIDWHIRYFEEDLIPLISRELNRIGE